MPPVASEATTRAHKQALPNPARAAQNSGPSQDSPFASLLDGGTQPAGDLPPQASPASGKSTRTTQTKPALTPADLLTDTTIQPAVQETPTKDTPMSPEAEFAAAIAAMAGTDKPVAADKANSQTSPAKPNADGEDAKPASDNKATDSVAQTNAAATPASVSAPAVVAVAPVAPTPASFAAPAAAPVSPPAGEAPQAVTDSLLQAAPSAIPQAALDGIPKAAPGVLPQVALAAKQSAPATETTRPKPSSPSAPQVNDGTPTDDLNSPAETPVAAQADGKPQPARNPDGPPQDAATSAGHRTVAAADLTPANASDTKTAAPKATADTLPPPLPAPQAAAPADVSSASANPVTVAPQTAAVAVPLAGVAIEIAGKALAGKNRFEIRLDPPELGRIEVRLDVGRNGQAVTHLMADRPDTLDLLRRDSSGLERALQDAGLKTSDSGLQFSLRDQGTTRDQSNAPTPGAAQLVVNDETPAPIDAGPRNYSRFAGLGGGIDIRV